MTADYNENDSFCIVGIGASAGGLEALQDLFKQMPDDSGAAYVVIQHLSPDYKSIMDELLSKCTAMPVIVAEDGIEVEPNHVYLIPPKKELTIQENILILTDQGRVNHVNLAIDTFFKSLAENSGMHAIAVVLSGAGSDGTEGSRYIKNCGGMVMAQEPGSAAFNSMPVSVIHSGLADYVLEPSAMVFPRASFYICGKSMRSTSPSTRNRPYAEGWSAGWGSSSSTP